MSRLYSLPLDKPIAPSLDQLRHTEGLLVGDGITLTSAVERMLGPRRMKFKNGTTLTDQIDHLLGPGSHVFRIDQPYAPQIKKQLGSLRVNLNPDQPIAAQLDRVLRPSKLDVPLDQPIAPHLDQLMGPVVPTAVAVSQDAMRRLFTLARNGQREECLQLQKELIEKHSDNAQLLNGIAWEVATKKLPGSLDDALKAAQQAVEVTKEQDAAVLDTLARVYFERGDLKQAIEWQKKAVALANDRERAELQEVLSKYLEEQKN